MPIIRPTSDNPNDLLAWPVPDGPINRIQVEKSAVGGGVGFSNVGSVTILPDTRSYTFYDGTGVSGDYYRWYYSNAANTFPPAGNRLYSPEQQSGGGNGLLCSLEDVQQEIKVGAIGSDPNRDELILGKIRQVSWEIERYCGRWLAPRPSNPNSTTTLTFDVEDWPYTDSLLLTNDARVVGIRTLTALGIATTTGGSYTSATLANVLLRPRPSADVPATRLEFPDRRGLFYRGFDTVQVTGSFGPASVPPDIQSAAIAAVVRRYGSGQAAPTVSLGEAGMVLLSNFSPEMRATLDSYKVPNVA